LGSRFIAELSLSESGHLVLYGLKSLTITNA
jgi:hypothetical protein